MGLPMMFASAPTSDDQWFGMRVREGGFIVDLIPGLFETKAASDDNAQRYVRRLK